MLNEIVQLEENKLGNDYIIGDVHGSAELQKVVDQLGLDDRLFIVGDLFDRGGHEVDVFNLISSDKRIHAVKGNHEELLLDVLDKSRVVPNRDEASRILFMNGGGWLSSNHQVQQFFHLWSNQQQLGMSVNNYISSFKTNEKIPEAQAIVNYVKELPYILRVGEGKNAFNVCHANMPISDADLDALIQSPKPLSADIKNHLVWARKDSKQNPAIFNDYANVRSPYSIPVYCGHNILDRDDDAVRKNTNHINLDGGAFSTHQFMMVNHTAKTVKLVGEKIETNRNGRITDENVSFLLRATDIITNHFEVLKTYQAMPDDTRSLFEHLNTLKNQRELSVLPQDKVIKELVQEKKTQGSSNEYKGIQLSFNSINEHLARIENYCNNIAEIAYDSDKYMNSETKKNRLLSLPDSIKTELSATQKALEGLTTKIEARLEAKKSVFPFLNPSSPSRSSIALISLLNTVNELTKTVKSALENPVPVNDMRQQCKNITQNYKEKMQNMNQPAVENPSLNGPKLGRP